jgi:hypothetical protein
VHPGVEAAEDERPRVLVDRGDPLRVAGHEQRLHATAAAEVERGPDRAADGQMVERERWRVRAQDVVGAHLARHVARAVVGEE